MCVLQTSIRFFSIVIYVQVNIWVFTDMMVVKRAEYLYACRFLVFLTLHIKFYLLSVCIVVEWFRVQRGILYKVTMSGQENA